MQEKIADIKKKFEEAGNTGLEGLFAEYADDPRAGVAGLIKRYAKKLKNLQEEAERLEAMKAYEKEYAQAGLIAGIDEAGRGPLAGPVVAAAVILPDRKSVV